MKQQFTAVQRRRMAWLGGGVVALVVLLPVMPSVASAFSPGSSTSAHEPSVVHVEVVAANAHLGIGQIAQPKANTPVFVACGKGRAVEGGYALPDSPTTQAGAMQVSAPADDDWAHWNFRYTGVMPVGTRLYAVCW